MKSEIRNQKSGFRIQDSGECRGRNGAKALIKLAFMGETLEMRQEIPFAGHSKSRTNLVQSFLGLTPTLAPLKTPSSFFPQIFTPSPVADS
jgi:hypothetical protein